MAELTDKERARLMFDRLISQPPPSYDEAIRQFTTAFSIVRAEGVREGLRRAIEVAHRVRDKAIAGHNYCPLPDEIAAALERLAQETK